MYKISLIQHEIIFRKHLQVFFNKILIYYIQIKIFRFQKHHLWNTNPKDISHILWFIYLRYTAAKRVFIGYHGHYGFESLLGKGLDGDANLSLKAFRDRRWNIWGVRGPWIKGDSGMEWWFQSC